MVILNLSFMILHERETEFLSWIRLEISQRLLFGKPGPVNPRLSALRQAGSEDYRAAEAHTIALQMEFDNRENAAEWNARQGAELAARFNKKFEPEALLFTSIFEVLPL